MTKKKRRIKLTRAETIFKASAFKMVKLVCFLPTIYDQISTGVLTLLHYMFSVIIFKKLQRICKDNFEDQIKCFQMSLTLRTSLVKSYKH